MASDMAELARQYGRPPEEVQEQVVDATASFQINRPSKDEARAQLAQAQNPEVPEDAEDIDPQQWLDHDDRLVIDYVTTRAGRLKIAALDENENDAVRKQAERLRNPGKPQMGRDINLKLLRLWTVAFSLNKAYGYWNTPKELSADMILKNKKLSGEITYIVQRISELSGYKEEGSSASSFLSVS